jgi:hypothetical protein
VEKGDREVFLPPWRVFREGHIEANWFPFLDRPLPETQQTPAHITQGKTNTPLALYLLYGIAI